MYNRPVTNIIRNSKLNRIKETLDDLDSGNTMEEDLNPIEENFTYDFSCKVVPMVVSLIGMFIVAHFEGFFSDPDPQFTFQTFLWMVLYSLVPGFISLLIIIVYGTVNELQISLSEAFDEGIEKDAVKEITAIQKSLTPGQSKSVPVRHLFGRTKLEQMGNRKGLDLFILIEPKDVLLEWTKMDAVRPVDNETKLA